MTDKSKPSPWLPIIISILTLVAGGGWGKFLLEKKAAETEQNHRYVVEYLSPILTLLNDNETIHKELYDSNLESGWGILESYVKKVQRDGFEDHALMKNRIRSLDKNNDRIVLLLEQYSGHMKSDELIKQSSEFRKHAIAWSDRLDSIAEVIKTGSQFPVAMPFPKAFPSSIEKEIGLRKENS